jgi:hypothetical protein
MTPGWFWVEAASRLLARDEREAVVGDLLEADESAGQALLLVLGLVVRREALHWKSWKPWVAAFGLALPSSFLLMGFSVSVSWMFPTVLHSVLEVEPNTNVVLYCFRHLIPQLLIFTGCAFTYGFVIQALSRRTFWVSAIACFGPCLFCLARFRSESLSALCLFLFFLPAAWGVREAMRGKRLGLHTAIGLAAGLTVLQALTSHNTWLNWLFFVPLLWPAWYMAAIGRQELNRLNPN